ncbi:MAG TPA: sterol desaturase family protein, partial [Acetobacteraceae bacterium]|nr:sterol desaturase family protein [Acetobacteraceae bacterium]
AHLGAHLTTSRLWLTLLSIVASFGVMLNLYARDAWARNEPLGWRGCLAYLAPRQILTGRDLRLDVQMRLMTHLIGPLLFLESTVIAGVVARSVKLAVSHALPPLTPPHPGPAAFVCIYVTAFLVYDFCNYTGHYLEHRVPILWELHKVHHSAETLTPLTARRFHPLQDQFDNLVIGLGLGLVFGCFSVFYCFDAYDFGFLRIDLWYMSELLTFHYLRHSHIPLRFGWLEWVLMSPAHHQLHHSREPRHWDRNFDTTLSIWDRMFGTLCDPVPGERFELGLPNDEHLAYRTCLDFYWRPVYRLAVLSGQQIALGAQSAAAAVRWSRQDTAPHPSSPPSSLPTAQDYG